MFETQSITRQTKTSYKLFYLAGFLLLIWAFYTVFFSTSQILINQKDLLTVPWPVRLEFADEPVPLDDFYVREAWEKEFLVALSRDYQNILYLKRSAKFFPLIEAELTKRGMPDDLKYLAVAESALKENSTSSASAAGIWQFVPSTGKRFGLIINDEIDERRHFKKATSAALNYLELLHRKFGSWTLAAAAYNSGENGLARRIEDQGVDGYYDLYLYAETSAYLFRILAIKTIMEDPATYGYDLTASDYFAWPDHSEVTAGAVADLAGWAREQGTTLRALKELNPWLVGGSLPAGEWVVQIPR